MNESEFEQALINKLTSVGWTYNRNVSGHTIDVLEDHFREVLFSHNYQTLKGKPLSDREFSNLRTKLIEDSSPYATHTKLIGAGGKGTETISRDDGTQVSLVLFTQDDVAGGSSTYEVVNQITFPNLDNSLAENRRIDIALLINGLPVGHLELKTDSSDFMQAFNQLQKYDAEGMYKDSIFNFVQIQGVMTPHSVKYMARPSRNEAYNKSYLFGWRDDNGKDVTDYRTFCDQLLSIPAFHRLISTNIIPDDLDRSIMVMRSYQIQATRKIIQRVRDMRENAHITKEGGYIWHTTGSGKTVTSFKVAQSLISMPYVEKVLFIVDRRDLIDQTYDNFVSYAYETMRPKILKGNTRFVKRNIESPDSNIILTSVQGLTRLVRDGFVCNKRMIILMDEAHRSASGDSVKDIKHAFRNTTWFGFTGTPNFYSDEVNDIETNTRISTTDVFGPRLHQYTIKDAIGDHNVLGFKVNYHKADEVLVNGEINIHAEQEIGVHDMYTRPEYRRAVALKVLNDIEREHRNRSNANYSEEFSGILAVSGKQAVAAYYNIFKEMLTNNPYNIRVAMTYSRDEDNGLLSNDLQRTLRLAIKDYDNQYNLNIFDNKNTEQAYLKNLTNRLAQKTSQYSSDDHLDLLIVSDQLLTGFDSKYVKTIYFDKVLHEGPLIQAMSRTNRVLSGINKPYGVVHFYREAEAMEDLVNKALTIYTKGGNDSLDDVAELDPDLAQLVSDSILADTYENQITELNVSISKLKELSSDDFSQNPRGESDSQEFIELGLEVYKKVNNLLQTGYELGTETGDSKIVLDLPSYERFDALKARIKDTNSTLPDSSQSNIVEYILNLVKYAEELIDFDKLVELFNAYIDETTESNLGKIEEHLSPMPKEKQESYLDLAKDIESGDITEHFDTKTLEIGVNKRVSLQKQYKILENFTNSEYDAKEIVRLYTFYQQFKPIEDQKEFLHELEISKQVQKESKGLNLGQRIQYGNDVKAYFKSLEN